MQNDRKAVFGWTMYDWANSAFATTVMAGFFQVFFKEYWSVGADATLSLARLGGANFMAGILVALSAPILGAIADKGTARKKMLLAFAFLGMAMTCGLYFISQGNWQIAVLVYVLATVGFSGANVFYDALITAVSNEERMDFISALGFALGYLGGGLLFAVNLAMYLKPELFGIPDANMAIRLSFLSVGIWWAIFTIPLIIWVKEPENPEAASDLNPIAAGFGQLAKTLSEIRQLKPIFLFLLAYWCYIDGVHTIIRMAMAYGLSLGFQAQDLVPVLLIVQFVGFPAAIIYGYAGEKVGTRKAIFFGIFIYLLLSIFGAFIHEKNHFYMMGVMIGLVQGGLQAMSRSYFGKIIPIEKSAEYFGFYNMMGKFAAVLGPLIMGGVGLLAASAGLGEDLSIRVSIVAVGLLFIMGGILFYFVDENATLKEQV